MGQSYQEQLRGLAELLLSARYPMALTGAGVSTESGIPDFRSPGTGLWEKIDPIRELSRGALMRDPARFYEIGLPRFRQICSAEPNPAHLVLAELEARGYLKGIITQNIDGLHVKAGSKNVFEVHGHLRTCFCMKCGKEDSFDLLVDLVESGVNPPICRFCQEGVLRPNVVLFHDPMPRAFYDAAETLRYCDFLMVVGSSLQVYPVAYLPARVEKLAIVNISPTPYDNKALVVIREKAGKVFSDLWELLRQEGKV